jgi:hypothetical protein
MPCNVEGGVISAGKNARIKAPIDHIPNNIKPALYRDFTELKIIIKPIMNDNEKRPRIKKLTAIT